MTEVIGTAALVWGPVGVNGSRMAAFAAGGILAMLSNSLIPFAHERAKGAGAALLRCVSFLFRTSRPWISPAQHLQRRGSADGLGQHAVGAHLLPGRSRGSFHHRKVVQDPQKHLRD